LKSGWIAGIAAYNLEGRTLKEVTWVTCRCFRFPTINSVAGIFDQPSYLFCSYSVWSIFFVEIWSRTVHWL
jgi:hypothetical protein